jgi:CBS domain containing-hemolysin-like protein
MINTLLIIVFGFLFSALFSGVETGSYMLNRIRLRHLVREGRRTAIGLSKLLARPYIFIYTVLIGNNIAIYLVSKEVTDLYLAGGLSAGGLVLGVIPWNAETAATLTLMFPLFLFAEVGPKNLFHKKADVLMYRFVGLMRLLVVILLPVTWILKQLFRILTHGADSAGMRDFHQLSPEALREYFTVGEKEGVISSEQSRMMDNVTAMHRAPVRMLMTPLRKVPVLQDHATVADLKRLLDRRETTFAVLMHRHAAVGIISMFEVVNRKLGDEEPVKPYAEDVLSVRDNRNLKSVFYRLRRNPRHSAVVVDGRKHPVGFVQLEDIARYIAKK